MEKKTKKEIKEIYKHNNLKIEELKFWASCVTIGRRPDPQCAYGRIIDLIDQLRSTAL